jgi:hypothetical protein
MERYNFKKLNSVEVKDQVKTSNRFAALENLYDKADISKMWESIRISKFLPRRV